ncbi:hypothetical protein EDB89DRAFT_1900683 [Lactarius sanguifluus]|nr:hypothetical protein EDB89DRAFT_1900683 [Lactarius sanguifluus]
MSIKRYFSQVSTSKDEGPQKKVKPSESPDLPTLDNELLPLLDLSSPSLSSHDSITEHFDKIAEHLFQRSYLVCYSTKRDGSPKWVLYEFLEFEFYMIKAGSATGSMVIVAATRKGLDLTIGTPDTPASSDSSPPIPVRGGILLRSLRRVTDSVVVSGPFSARRRIVAVHGSLHWQQADAHFVSDLQSLRVSASISRTHLCRTGVYNMFANPIDSTSFHDFLPRTVAGKRSSGFTTTAVDTLKVSKSSLAGKIASLSGLKPQTVDKYLKAYRDALAFWGIGTFHRAERSGCCFVPGTFPAACGRLATAPPGGIIGRAYSEPANQPEYRVSNLEKYDLTVQDLHD